MSPASRRSALVTGGAGFIGSHLVERLLAEDWAVRVIDDLSSGRESNLAGCAERVDFVRGDVCDDGAMARATEDVEVVFHHAAISSVPRSLDEPISTNRANIDGTLHVLEAARRAGVRRVVYAASSSAYGDAGESPKVETMEANPASLYALQKLTGELYCRLYREFFGLETVALRYFNVFGPRQDPASEYAAVIPRFVAAALGGTPAEIYGDGEQTRDFVFVSDAAAANLLAADAPGAAGEAINIAGGSATSLNQLWHMICDLVGVEIEAHHADPRVGDVRESRACIARAAETLGYEPSVDLQEGLRLTIDSFRKSGGPEEE